MASDYYWFLNGDVRCQILIARGQEVEDLPISITRTCFRHEMENGAPSFPIIDSLTSHTLDPIERRATHDDGAGHEAHGDLQQSTKLTNFKKRWPMGLDRYCKS